MFFHLIYVANVVLAPVIIKGISFLVIANGVKLSDMGISEVQV